MALASARKQMHQTTVRFDSQLWQRIDAESARLGVSAAQYIRDATLIRLTRGAPDEATAAITDDVAAERLYRSAASAVATSDDAGMGSRAVWAQARQARDRARTLRDASHRLTEGRGMPQPAGSAPSEQPSEGRHD